MNKFTKQCVAAVASLAMAGTLCVAGAVVAGSSAWANPSVDTTGTKGTTGVDKDSAQPSYGNAPWNLGNEATTKTGSITIYKWKDEVAGGKQKKEAPVKGAGFTIKKVKSIGSTTLDLTKYSDWSEIAKNVKQLNNGEINATGADSKLKVEFDTLTLNGDTNADGVVKFKDLPLGLYQVQETKVPAGYSAADGGKAFYMTLPMIEKVTQPGGTTTETKYNYAPFVDPKNVDLNGTVTKTQDLAHTVGAGDTIEYTIKAKLDKSKADTKSENVKADEFKGYTIFDLAPSDYFTAYDQSVITKMTVGDTENQGTVTPGTPLNYNATEAQSDYTVDSNETIAAVTTSGKEDVARKKIKIEFTASGRTKLADEVNKDANAGKAVYVTVHFKFTLKDSATLKTNKVTNKASVIPSHVPGTTVPDEIPSDNPPSTDFATFKIKKVSSQDENKALGGAKFRLFAVENDATACTNAIKAGTTGTELDKVCKDKSSTGFGEKETANTADGGKTVGETDGYSVKRGTEFYVVETEAPKGYIRNPDVHKVTVATDKTEDTFTVKNIPDSGNGGKGWLFNLPKTGAAGVVIFALAGVCLVCFGIFVFMRNRKKDEEQQAA